MLPQNRATRELGQSLIKHESLQPAEKTESHYPVKSQDSFPAAVSPMWSKIRHPVHSASLVLPEGANDHFPRALLWMQGGGAQEREKKYIRSLESKEKTSEMLFCGLRKNRTESSVSRQSSGPGLSGQAQETLPQQVEGVAERGPALVGVGGMGRGAFRATQWSLGFCQSTAKEEEDTDRKGPEGGGRKPLAGASGGYSRSVPSGPQLGFQDCCRLFCST